MSIAPGTRLGSYEIVAAIGAGGMGEVYRARHLKLGRHDAIKVLPSDVASDPERLQRFEREARSASALNHPNIVTIYDVAEQEGATYIAMELVEGRTLRERVREGPLPVSEAVRIASQIGEGLGKAHAAGLVHRDLKPDNVMVTGEGLVKILDFGLAKAIALETPGDSELTTLSKATAEGVVLGTPHYMSPEQAAAGPVDHRSDQFSFGVLLYELLCARRPFEGPSVAAVLSAILRDPPTPPRSLRPDLPEELSRILDRCLAKDPAARFRSMEEVREQLVGLSEPGTASRKRLAVPRRLAVGGIAAFLAAVLLAGAWAWLRGSRARWVRGEALPEIARRTEAGEIFAAYRLAVEAMRHAPGDPDLQKAIERITLPLPVHTQPEGAEVFIKDYATPEAPWEHLGRTPLAGAGIPYTLMRWKLEKEGYDTIEAAPFGIGSLGALARGLPLHRAGTRPAGMVGVPAGRFEGTVGIEIPNELPDVDVGAHWIDRYEVTNREFEEFVEAGGYDDPDLWQTPFSDGSREWTREEAMALFRDTTGRPGPATWELGAYPVGAGDLPVAGVSWYEAAAYCAFRDKTLPTIYHWYWAAELAQFSDILQFSNFDSDRPAPVGFYAGLGPYGTYDMAGNVREWCWNATLDGSRYAAGGAYGEPSYMYGHVVARSPLERSARSGFRCARYIDAPGEELLEPVSPRHHESPSAPVSGEVFEAYLAMYDYERTALEAVVESVDDSSPHWRKEKVSFDAAYGDERVPVYLFLPRNAQPPFQTVVWYPGNDVLTSLSSERLTSAYLWDFIPRSGRALVYPIYKGTYERFVPFSRAPTAFRDMMLLWSKDLGRTLDYLATREDIDGEKLAYYGFSSGAVYGPILTAVDPRFAASVLLGAGLRPIMSRRPEMDLVQFAPRSRVPTLMINGRDDFIMPHETSQLPLFRLLGAPERDKRLARLEGGHLPSRRDIMRETLEWLDRYLGPVDDRASEN